MTIKEIQTIVGVTADGINGPKTQAAIKAWQSAHGLVADGIVGPKTEAAMSGNSAPASTPAPAPKNNPTPSPVSTPTSTSSSTSSSSINSALSKDEIKRIQGIVGVTQDGIFGPKTTAAVKAYQSANGLSADGVVGPKTLAVMNKQPAGATNTPSTDPTSPDAPLAPTTVGTPAAIPNGFQEDYNKSGDTPTSYYGKEKNADAEQPALQEEQGIIKAAGSANLVSSSFLSKLSSDPSIVGFYVNALAYGGYTMGDILNDMKRRELVSQGNADAKNLKIIDPEVNRSNYQATAEGQKSISQTASMIPTFNLQGVMDPNILKYGANVPDELFKTLVPILDKNSSEFKDAVANVKSAFYDLANAQLQAGTEQEKSVADYNYKNFKEQIEKQYGIVLSDDATKAWKQIEGIEADYGNKNIEGSGLEAEAIDDSLKATRKQDQILRDQKLTTEEQQKAAYYRSSASEAEVAALSDADKEKYGLKPSADILAQYDMATLKAKYPDQSEAELKAYRDSVLDSNGNYRSTLYSKYQQGVATNNQSKKSTAENQVMTDSLNKESSAYRNYDQSQPFSQTTPSDNSQMSGDAAANPNPPNQPVPPAALDPNKINYNSNTGQLLKPGETYVDAKTGQTLKQGDPFDPAKYSSLVKSTTSSSPTPAASSSGSMSITDIQKLVGVTPDGINGPKTQAAIKAYQTANGLQADGIVGPKTLAVMQGSSSSSSSQAPTSSYTAPKPAPAPTPAPAPKTTTSSPAYNPALNTATTDQRNSAGLLVNPPGAKFDRNTGKPL